MKQLEERLNHLNTKNHEYEMDKDNLLNRIKSLEYSISMIEKALNQSNFEKKELANQLADMQNEMEIEKVQIEQVLSRKIKEREMRDMLVATVTIEDARRESQYYMNMLRKKIAENTEFIDQKTRLTFDLAEIKEKLGQ